MDDLIPFFVFIIIALINLAKFMIERGAKEQPPPAEGENLPKHRPSSPLEDFFGELAKKLDPVESPADLPDPPDDYAKTDFTAEQTTYEAAQKAEPEDKSLTTESIPVAEPAETHPSTEVKLVHTSPLQSAMKAMPVMKSSFTAGNIPAMPVMRSSTAGSIHFSLSKPAELRKAILAKVVLDPPRAFDTSFEHTARR
ncbi:hypothetical protein EGM51_16395 [Verrucomicrobia bacterium S94]|nr:hypothetical protein EGM51_16395 [Verrucomicrobia bacterium S94]